MVVPNMNVDGASDTQAGSARRSVSERTTAQHEALERAYRARQPRWRPRSSPADGALAPRRDGSEVNDMPSNPSEPKTVAFLEGQG